MIQTSLKLIRLSYLVEVITNFYIIPMSIMRTARLAFKEKYYLTCSFFMKKLLGENNPSSYVFVYLLDLDLWTSWLKSRFTKNKPNNNQRSRINWRPQRDSNPRRRRERPVSWARLDDGDLPVLTKKK